MLKLLTAAGPSVTGAAEPLGKPPNRSISYLSTLYVWGDFGASGVAKLQASPDGSEWFDVDGAANITAKTMLNVELRSQQIRGVTDGNVVSIDMAIV